jgi:hypothetical protein
VSCGQRTRFPQICAISPVGRPVDPGCVHGRSERGGQRRRHLGRSRRRYGRSGPVAARGGCAVHGSNAGRGAPGARDTFGGEPGGGRAVVWRVDEGPPRVAHGPACSVRIPLAVDGSSPNRSPLRRAGQPVRGGPPRRRPRSDAGRAGPERRGRPGRVRGSGCRTWRRGRAARRRHPHGVRTGRAVGGRRATGVAGDAGRNPERQPPRLRSGALPALGRPSGPRLPRPSPAATQARRCAAPAVGYRGWSKRGIGRLVTRGGVLGRRSLATARPTRGCRSASSRGWRARAVPALPAGPRHPRRGG